MKIQLLLTNMLACGVVILISGCHPSFNDEHSHHALCQELRHRINFNGATSNDSKAFAQRADYDKLSREYQDENCE